MQIKTLYQYKYVPTIGFTIIEAIIAIALLAALSVFIFSVAQPLKLHIEKTKSGLEEFGKMQFLAIYLQELVSSSDMYKLIDVNTQDAESELESISYIPISVLNEMSRNQKYILFTLKLNKVACGFFKSNAHIFTCMFIYSSHTRTLDLVHTDRDTISNSVDIEKHHAFNQVKIRFGAYDISVGFLPTIKQVIQ